MSEILAGRGFPKRFLRMGPRTGRPGGVQVGPFAWIHWRAYPQLPCDPCSMKQQAGNILGDRRRRDPLRDGRSSAYGYEEPWRNFAVICRSCDASPLLTNAKKVQREPIRKPGTSNGGPAQGNGNNRDQCLRKSRWRKGSRWPRGPLRSDERLFRFIRLRVALS